MVTNFLGETYLDICNVERICLYSFQKVGILSARLIWKSTTCKSYFAFVRLTRQF